MLYRWLLLHLLPVLVLTSVPFCCLQASYPQMGDFAAVDFVRMLDGLERMGAPPSPEWVTQFWSVSANKIVRTAEKVSRLQHMPPVDEIMQSLSCCLFHGQCLRTFSG